MIFLRSRSRHLFASALAVACLLVAAPASGQEVSSAVNISTRMKVETGDNVLIGGFIVTGSGQKTVAVRALGPSLAVNGALGNPVLELFDASGAVVATNDDWRASQAETLIAAGLAPGSDLDAALIATLNAGSYTAVVRGAGGATGVALVEVYDLDGPEAVTRLGNLSTRGRVLTGDDVMIGGFILRGDVPKRMMMRVRGPTLSLGGSPISGRLADPTLELFDANGVSLAQNDNWRTTQESEIAASSIPPSDDREPAIVATLAPGNYTAVVRGQDNSIGIGLIEMYDLDQPPQADGSTLYIAQLRGLNGSNGSGTATLRVSADGKSAIFSFSYSNLSSPITSMHIHGPANQGESAGVLFDPDEAMPQPDGTYIWVFSPVGNNSVEDIIAAISSGRTYFNIHTSNNPGGEITGFFNLSTGAQVAPVPTPPPALAGGTPTPGDAARFLSQSTFGPNDALITKVQREGFEAFLGEQFAAPMSSHRAYVEAVVAALPSPSPSATPNQPIVQHTRDAWWTHAIAGPDQLRQRVAFALHEILVVSVNSAGLGGRPYALPTYYDVLVRNAFGNYRQLLEEITLNPAMGAYLNMLQSQKADPARGRLPNENYPRELLQLFSIGLYNLNLDGSLTLGSDGSPIATYQQDVILGMSAALTGWTYGQTGTPVFYPGVARQDWRVPMVSIASYHDTNAKQILSGVALPAAQTAEQDLRTTLDTVFAHPNVGPFISRQLIQRLVTSNPSPGYVYRVASVFNNNGQGVRGDLKAVIRAILVDYDARGEARTSQGAGKQREPVLRVTNLLRAFKASSPSGRFSVRNAYASLAQEAMFSPTVFNFFSPDYQRPGAIAAAGLKSPEFEITTETTVATTANFLRNAIYSYLGPNADRITLNISDDITLASDPTRLVDHLNGLFLANSMSPTMRNIMINAINQIPATSPTERARTAIYLVINSPEYVIER